MRFNRGLWLWLGGLLLAVWAFLLAITIAYFVKEPGYSLFGNGWMVCRTAVLGRSPARQVDPRAA